MIEQYKKLIKFMKIMRAFDEYLHVNGHDYRYGPFKFFTNNASYMYKRNILTIISDIGVHYNSTAFLHNGRLRTNIACNNLAFGDNHDGHGINIQYNDDYFRLFSQKLYSYSIQVKDALTEEMHFQYTLLDDIPSIEKLTEYSNIFDLLFANQIGYMGPAELLDFEYDNFLHNIRDKTNFISSFWETIDV